MNKTNILILFVYCLICNTTFAEDDRPTPTSPPEPVEEITSSESTDDSQMINDSVEKAIPDDLPKTDTENDSSIIPNDTENEIKTPLLLDGQKIDDTLIAWIVDTTGKIVLPLGNMSTINRKEITVICPRPLTKREQLDLVFETMRMNQVGVAEFDDIIVIGAADEVSKDLGNIPILSGDESVLERRDRGTIVLKFFPVKQASASSIADLIANRIENGDSVGSEEASNQVVVLGPVGLCQQVERMIQQLDKKWVNEATKTFRLQHSDASEIAANIDELFSDTGSTRTNNNSRNNNRNNRNQGGSTSDNAVPLRYTVNVAQNTVTVIAEPDVIERIEELIKTEWDLPRSEFTKKLYVLKYTDPIQMRDLLNEILGTGGSSSSRNTGRGGNRAAQNAGPADVTAALSGIYRFEAVEDKNALFVICKTEESFQYLDSIIEEIDQPSPAGLPMVIPLQYANAVDLAQELNALLASAGRNAPIDAPDEGLSASSSFGSDSGATDTGRAAETGNQLTFPWQSGGGANQEQAAESSLIGRIRIVPISRQNALAVLAPPSFHEPIKSLISDFDLPTRQVMISATIAEVEITDALDFGIFLNDSPSSSTGAFTGTFESRTASSFLDQLLDTAAAGADLAGLNAINYAIQALKQVTNVRIIQEPQVFTADNEEAVFFDGQEYPFVSDSQLTDTGQTNTTIEYRNIGVLLNVRPRITSVGDVNLEINLEISQDSGNTDASTGGIIFTRRQASSEVTIEDNGTIVLGGLMVERESEGRAGIPLLMDLPLIGGAFRNTDKDKRRFELVLFVTPTVLERPDLASDEFSDRYKDKLKKFMEPLKDVKKFKDLDELKIRANNADSTIKSNMPTETEMIHLIDE